ncbi:MAG: hypothetical protein R3A10_20580, partial [Caldilineaceae bacterium]
MPRCSQTARQLVQWKGNIPADIWRLSHCKQPSRRIQMADEIELKFALADDAAYARWTDLR